jgi:hypothetical protein
MLDGAAGAAGSCAVNENRQNDERAKSNFSIRVFSSCVVVREYMPEVVLWGSFTFWWESWVVDFFVSGRSVESDDGCAPTLVALRTRPCLQAM